MRALDERVFALLNAEQQVGSRGLSPSDIDAIEDELGFPTPPDFRVLLQNVEDLGGVLFPWSRFDRRAYQRTIDRVLRGVLFDVEEAELWLTRWGERPDTALERMHRVRDDFATWPRLLPIHSHRYLAAEPCETGNPVFSIVQTDIIYYGSDLASYLLDEFVARGPADRRYSDYSPSGSLRRIPIWSDFAERTPGFAVEKPVGERAQRFLDERQRIEPRSWPRLDEE